MASIDEFLSYIEANILKPLFEIEEAFQEIVEDWSSKLGVPKPRVTATIQEVNECIQDICAGRDQDCTLITGVYIPESSTILVNYRSSPDVLLHLFIHHVQAQQVGVDKFAQIRNSERVRLPWSLRPSEIRAFLLAKKLYDTLCTQRVLKLWTDYVKPRIRKIDEEVQRVKPVLASMKRSSLPMMQVRVRGYAMLREEKHDWSWTWKD